MGHHGLHQSATDVVPEADVAILVAGDGEWQRRVRHNLSHRYTHRGLVQDNDSYSLICGDVSER